MESLRKYIICLLGGAVIGAMVAKKYYPTLETKTEYKTDTAVKTIIKRETVTKAGDKIKEIISQDERVTESAKSVTAPRNRLYQIDIAQFTDQSKQLHVSKKVLGNLSVGGIVDTKGRVGVSIGLSF